MKYFYLLFGLIPALLAGNPAFAQISIDEVDAKEDKVTFQDKLKSTSVDVDYFSLARYKAERAAIRKERNYLEFSGGIQGSLTSYNDPWISVSGGDNSIALTAVFGLLFGMGNNQFVSYRTNNQCSHQYDMNCIINQPQLAGILPLHFARIRNLLS